MKKIPPPIRRYSSGNPQSQLDAEASHSETESSIFEIAVDSIEEIIVYLISNNFWLADFRCLKLGMLFASR